LEEPFPPLQEQSSKTNPQVIARYRRMVIPEFLGWRLDLALSSRADDI